MVQSARGNFLSAGSIHRILRTDIQTWAHLEGNQNREGRNPSFLLLPEIIETDRLDWKMEKVP